MTDVRTDHRHAIPGTGGTISGTGNYLKSMNQDVLVVLSDPEGSGMYNKVPLGYFEAFRCLTESPSSSR